MRSQKVRALHFWLEKPRHSELHVKEAYNWKQQEESIPENHKLHRAWTCKLRIQDHSSTRNPSKWQNHSLEAGGQHF